VALALVQFYRNVLTLGKYILEKLNTLGKMSTFGHSNAGCTLKRQSAIAL